MLAMLSCKHLASKINKERLNIYQKIIHFLQSFFDRFFIDFGSQDPLQNPPKIDEKSILKSVKKSLIF